MNKETAQTLLKGAYEQTKGLIDSVIDDDDLNVQFPKVTCEVKDYSCYDETGKKLEFSFTLYWDIKPKEKKNAT